MQPVNRNPSPRELRNFGWVMLGGFALIGAVLWYRGIAPDTGWWPRSGWGYRPGTSHVIAIALWGLAVLFPLSVNASADLGRRIYVVWMAGANYLGTAVTTIALTLIFVVVLPPFSLVRLKDPLRFKRRGSGTYWEEHVSDEATVERMTRPF